MIRRLQLLVLAAVLVIAAFSTGAEFLFFLVYLGILVVGGSYVMTRYGLADLEAGFTLDRTHAHVGEPLAATYTLRNASPFPKLWLEVHNPSDLPVPVPGRAVALGPRGERSWVARVPLPRRGHYRVEPMVIRTGDPFGFFESYASVGSGARLVVYPRLETLPRWRLPPASLEGTHASSERAIQTTPLVTSIRPYVPGDSFSRIHWKSTARHQELQVREFDVEQTTDVWLFLDLDRRVHVGDGDESTIEAAARVAAAIASRALLENRSLGFTASGSRSVVLPADRGPRQQQKVMELLAAVHADGSTPLAELLIQGLPRLRRGMTAVVITPSVDRDWVRPMTGLRARGINTVVCLLDALAYDEHGRRAQGAPPLAPEVREDRTRAGRALRHALAEYEFGAHTIVPARPLGEMLLAGGRTAAPAVRA